MGIISVRAPDRGGTAALAGKESDLDTIKNVVLYSPAPDFVGEETFIYQISDGKTVVDGTVTVEVTPGDNDAPIARDDTFRVSEDSRENILPVLLNNGQGVDHDPENEPLTITETTLPDQGGAVAIGDNGTPLNSEDDVLVYSPKADFIGVERFSYRIDDGVHTAVATVLVEVENANSDAPLAQDDRFSVLEDSSSNRLNVLRDNGLGPDRDPDNDPLTLVSVGEPEAGGRVTLEKGVSLGDLTDDGVRYTPFPDFQGTDVFTYSVTDGSFTDIGLVTVTVLNIDDDPPRALNDQFDVEENSTGQSLTVLLDNGQGRDFDPDGDPIVIESVGWPRIGGSTELEAEENEVVFTPSENFVGLSVFTYSITDGSFFDVAYVTVTVTDADNRAPVARPDRFEVQEDTQNELLTVLLDHGFGSDSDPDADRLALTSVSRPSRGGHVELHAEDDADPEHKTALSYTPVPDFVGVEIFTYTLHDGVLSAVGLVTVTVQNIDNDAPLAQDDEFLVGEDSSDQTLLVLANNNHGPDRDPDGDELTIQDVGGPNMGGRVRIDRNGTPSDPDDDFIGYTPRPNFIGIETFTYSVTDGTVAALAQVTVRVVNTDNDPPVIRNDRVTVGEDSVDNPIAVLSDLGQGVDFDPDSDSLSVIHVGIPSDGGPGILGFLRGCLYASRQLCG